MKIAINGPMCSGKSTIANIIKEHNDRYSIYSFGGRVKELAFELFGMRNKDRSLLINVASKMREIPDNQEVLTTTLLHKRFDFPGLGF